FDQTIMDGLTNPGGPDDITGKDAAGRYYVDVVSFHTYPFSGAQTRTQVVTKLTSANSLPDNLAHLNSRIAAANTFHNRTGTAALKTAITEANIAWQNNAGDDVSGLGTNSFIGGQFVSEMMSIALKNSVDFFNIWSVIEGNTPVSDIGYIDPSSSIKKPLFYHFKMMADNFKGNYANGTTNKPNVKAFGSKNSQEITVMILNEEQTGTYNYTVRLNTSPVTGTNPLKVNLDAGVAMEYADAVPSQSTVLLTFNASGTLIRKTTYSLNDALANLAPTITNLITTGISDNTAAPVDDNHFDVKVFPNPSAGSFTIELNKNNTSGKEYEVMIVNMIGQEVYLKKTTFTGRREPIDLDGVLAAGTYIVRVKQGDGVITKKIIVGS
ncbi:MAG: T9SS type A sorting domain-containing protein, partial [Bacteroidia bacterium]